MLTKEEFLEKDEKMKATIYAYEAYKEQAFTQAKKYLKEVKGIDLDERRKMWLSYELVKDSMKSGPIQIQEYLNDERRAPMKTQVFEIPREVIFE